MFKLYLVRHAQSEANVGLVSSDFSTSVTSVGVEQAVRLANYLKSVSFDLIISSPYTRAKLTAKHICERTGVSLEFDDLLVERDKGEFTGKDRSLFNSAAKSAGLSTNDFTPLGGENYGDVYNRAKSFFEKLLLRVKEESLSSVLVVSHNAFISCLSCFLVNRPYSDTKFFGVKNTSISWFEFDDDFELVDFELSTMTHILKGV